MSTTFRQHSPYVIRQRHGENRGLISRSRLNDTQVVPDRSNEFAGRGLSLPPERIPLARIGSRPRAACTISHVSSAKRSLSCVTSNGPTTDDLPCFDTQIEQDVLDSRVVNIG